MSGFLGGGIGPTAIKRRSGLAAPVPVAGAELIVDGGLENWASATDLTSWIEDFGTGSVNREAAAYAGDYAMRLDHDATTGLHGIYQNVVGHGTRWIVFSLYAKASATPATIYMYLGAMSLTLPLTADWGAVVATGRQTILSMGALSASSSKSIYVDEVSVKPLTLSSLLSTRPYASANCDLSVAVTRTAGTQAGLAMRVDDPANPQNFILAYETGAGRVRIDKCVAGVYTNVVDAAITYVAGQNLRGVCAGNDVSVYYNGTQVGTTQTVADAGIVSNTRHGLFSTYADNAFTGYTAA